MELVQYIGCRPVFKIQQNNEHPDSQPAGIMLGQWWCQNISDFFHLSNSLPIWEKLGQLANAKLALMSFGKLALRMCACYPYFTQCPQSGDREGKIKYLLLRRQKWLLIYCQTSTVNLLQWFCLPYSKNGSISILVLNFLGSSKSTIQSILELSMQGHRVKVNISIQNVDGEREHTTEINVCLYSSYKRENKHMLVVSDTLSAPISSKIVWFFPFKQEMLLAFGACCRDFFLF